MSRRPRSMAAALRRTSGGGVTGPAVVGAAARTSAHRGPPRESWRTAASTAFAPAAGHTPGRRVAAPTGAPRAVPPGPRRRVRARPKPQGGSREREVGAQGVTAVAAAEDCDLHLITPA